MSIDYGDSRTGYAISDKLLFGASVLPALKEKNMRKVAEHSAQLALEYGAQLIVVGFPKNMNGTVGPRGEKTKNFVTILKTMTNIPVELWDERLTTVSAHNLMNETNVRGKKRKDSVDSISAAILLETYIASRH